MDLNYNKKSKEMILIVSKELSNTINDQFYRRLFVNSTKARNDDNIPIIPVLCKCRNKGHNFDSSLGYIENSKLPHPAHEILSINTKAS